MANFKFPSLNSPASLFNGNDLSRRRFLQASSLAAFGAMNLGNSYAAVSQIEAKIDGDITWLAFDGYFAPEVVSNFEKKYGVKVNFSYMNSNSDLIPKLSSGNPIDLVTANSAVLDQLITGKLIQPFSPSAVENWKNLAPFFAKPFYDTGDMRYSSIYNIYAPTILVRTDKLPNAENDVSSLWKYREEAKGHISLFDDEPTNFGNALLHLDKDLRSPTQQDITDAADALRELTSYIIGFQGPQMADVALGNTWLGSIQDYTNADQVFQSKYADKILMTYSKKPWIETDLKCIGANAKSPGTALAFINWLLEPEQSVAQANFFTINNGVPAGTEACANGPARKKAPNFYPSPLVDENLLNNQKLWIRAPAGPLGRFESQQWQRVKAG